MEAASEANELKAAKNQALFREVNERVEDLSRSQILEFLCECVDEACTDAITLARPEYDDVRRLPERFAIAPGHDRPEFERVVKTNERFVVVEKRGEGATVARMLDPRTGRRANGAVTDHESTDPRY